MRNCVLLRETHVEHGDGSRRQDLLQRGGRNFRSGLVLLEQRGLKDVRDCRTLRLPRQQRSGQQHCDDKERSWPRELRDWVTHDLYLRPAISPENSREDRKSVV